MKLLRVYFFRFFQLMNSVGNRSVAEYYAIILMTMILSINVIFLYALIFVFLGLKLDAKLLTGILFVGFLILFYFQRGASIIFRRANVINARNRRHHNYIFSLGYVLNCRVP